MSAQLSGILIYPGQTTAGAPLAAFCTGALAALARVFPGTPVYVSHAHMAGEHSDTGIIALTAEESASLATALKSIFDRSESSNARDTIAICYGWYVLLDPELSQAARADHEQYLAHITYCENVPPGFLPDYVSREFIEALPADETATQDLRAYAFRNIDRFDVEIFYQRPDLRQYRLDFTATSARSIAVLKAMSELRASAEHTGVPALRFAELEPFLVEHPEVLRPYPSYIEVELSAEFAQADFAPVFWPAPQNADTGERRSRAGTLDQNLLAKLKTDISTNALTRDVTVAFAGAGECFCHPQLVETVSEFLQLDQVKQVIIETYGVGVAAGQLDALFALPGASRLAFIVRLNTLRPDRYRELFGVDCGRAALDFIDTLSQILGRTPEAARPQVYVEMLRLAETDDELDGFMQRFDRPEEPLQPLLQKYNRYIERLPERRAANLTPLGREFCWHLARDLYLTVDGRVPLCRQDPYGEAEATADFRSQSVREILAASAPAHAASVRGEHETIPMPCLQCDEWYTFNG